MFGRTLQRWRPYICPLRRLIEAVPPGSRVLDVGCGAGLFLGLLAYTGRVTSGHGFDSNQSALALAETMRRRLPNPDLLCFEPRDVTESWPEGPFDVVSMIDLMHHLPAEARGDVIAKAVSRLTPQGALLYKDMADRPLRYAWANRLHDLVIVGQWIEYSPLAVIKEWAIDLGVKCEVEDRWTALWYAHEFMLLRRTG